jgi:hypothetical protein
MSEVCRGDHGDFGSLRLDGLRDAAELAGCSHHTVAEYVAARERGELTPGRAQRREMLVDPYREKLEGTPPGPAAQCDQTV